MKYSMQKMLVVVVMFISFVHVPQRCDAGYQEILADARYYANTDRNQLTIIDVSSLNNRIRVFSAALLYAKAIGDTVGMAILGRAISVVTQLRNAALLGALMGACRILLVDPFGFLQPTCDGLTRNGGAI